MDTTGEKISYSDYLMEDPEFEIFHFGDEAVYVPREVTVMQSAPNTNANKLNGIIVDKNQPSTSKEKTALVHDDYSYQEANEDAKVDFKVVTTDELVGLMNKIIDEVNMVAELPSTIARILLIHFKWDKETLLERYYSCSSDEDLQKLFEEARIVYKANKSPKKPKTCEAIESDTVTCLICYDELSRKEMKSLDCGHQFCSDCWVKYLTNKIIEDGEADYISCPTDCKILVDDEMVLRLIPDSGVKAKYLKLMTNNFVSNNRRLQWCPGTECQNVIQTPDPHSKGAANSYCLPVTCKCDQRFCFLCGNEWHEPVLCVYLSKWKMKCQDKDNTETMNYLCSFTKDCPKCKVTIEKNGGCKFCSFKLDHKLMLS